ncbi:hypothetical protein [Methylobacterium sp. Leaf469]|uniref:hypothetical protein n=1 Tax=Methylobacterium sp. Leaf469 TaxID=1736387 RepID=UPI00138F42A0|nr:hypothetical protein [Methylobacterium sp. Leaf469]
MRVIGALTIVAPFPVSKLYGDELSNGDPAPESLGLRGGMGLSALRTRARHR